MKYIKILLLVLFGFTAQSQSLIPGVQKMYNIGGRDCLVWVPTDTTVKKHLLISFVGNSTNDSAAAANQGPAKRIRLSTSGVHRDSFFVITVLRKSASPNENGSVASLSSIDAMLDWVFASCTFVSTDSNYNSMTGLSQGNQEVFRYLSNWGSVILYTPRHREKFSREVLLSNGADESAKDYRTTGNYRPSGTRVWYGTSDGTTGTFYPVDIYNFMLALNPAPRTLLTAISGGGHDNGVWDSAWSLSSSLPSSNTWLWLLNYTAVSTLKKIPIRSYMVYNLSGGADRNDHFINNGGGSVRIDQMFRVNDDPRNGIYGSSGDYDKTAPRQTGGINRTYYLDGGMVIWVDLGRKWHIKEVYWRDVSYYGNWLSIWWGDSAQMYRYGQIANPDTSIAQINFKTPDLLASPTWNNQIGFTDSARFIMIRLARSNDLINGFDSLADISQLVFYGDETETVILKDSILKRTPKTAEVENWLTSGANISTPRQDSLISWITYPRNYYARSQDGTNINYPSTDTATDHPNQKFNFLVAGADSAQRLRGQRNFHVMQGPTARAWRLLTLAGECTTTLNCNVWTPVDGPGLNYKDTSSYTSVREFSRQWALVYGKNGKQLASTIVPLNESQRRINRNQLWGMQDGNEDNKWWFGRYESPMVYAAKSWAIHNGIRTATDSMAHLMTGMAWNPEYVRSILYLMKMYADSVWVDDICLHYYSSSYNYTNWPILPNDVSMVGQPRHGIYPESYPNGGALYMYDTLVMFLRREMSYDTRVRIAITEYGKDKLMVTRPAMGIGASNVDGITDYGVQQYDSYDSTISHAIDGHRERLALTFSLIDWSAYFSFDDYASHTSKPSGGFANYFGAYVSSGMINVYDLISGQPTRWPLWFLEKNYHTRYARYVPDTVLSYVNGGVCAVQARHINNPDSILIIVWEGDLQTNNQAYSMPTYGATSVTQTLLSMSVDGGYTTSTLTGSGSSVALTTNVVPRYYTFLAGAAPPPSSNYLRWRRKILGS